MVDKVQVMTEIKIKSNLTVTISTPHQCTEKMQYHNYLIKYLTNETDECTVVGHKNLFKRK